MKYADEFMSLGKREKYFKGKDGVWSIVSNILTGKGHLLVMFSKLLTKYSGTWS